VSGINPAAPEAINAAMSVVFRMVFTPFLRFFDARGLNGLAKCKAEFGKKQ
jgi:hypothetical protein